MKSLKTIALVSCIMLTATTSVFASWWNPFTWGMFKRNTVPALQDKEYIINEKVINNETKKGDIETINKNVPYKQSDFTWLIENLGEDEHLTPHVKIRLQIKGVPEKLNIGDYSLSCDEQTSSYYKGNAKVSKSVICWWGGYGKEIAVFLENGKYMVKVAEIGETSPNVKLPPIEFKSLFEIKK